MGYINKTQRYLFSSNLSSTFNLYNGDFRQWGFKTFASPSLKDYCKAHVDKHLLGIIWYMAQCLVGETKGIEYLRFPIKRKKKPQFEIYLHLNVHKIFSTKAVSVEC